LLNYSIVYLLKADEEGKIQILSALDIVGGGKEKDD